MKAGPAVSPRSIAAPTPRHRSPAPWRASQSRDPRFDPHQYDFLADTLVDRATLERAHQLARRWNVAPQTVMLAQGWIRADDYARALAQRCGADRVRNGDLLALAPPDPAGSPRDCLRKGLLVRRRGFALDATARRPVEVWRALADLTRYGRPALATEGELHKVVARTYQRMMMDRAVRGLARRSPSDCAEGGLTPTQRVVIACVVALIALGLALAPIPTLRVLAGVATLFFALVVALRVAACAQFMLAAPLRLLRARSWTRMDDAALPVYTILVPLYREARVLPQLVSALMRLDYPAAKLDIKLVMEGVDRETIAAAEALELPHAFEIVVVPEGGPRTKPKALNYALQFARGEYVAIYDAEDRPEPDQLRRALAAFARGPAHLACVQARLNFYNPSESWLAKQFTIEYGALFDGLLPALERLGLPIPLGGTSCHFRASALGWLEAWDAFNVTEDADLGMRLARRGYTCAVLDSTTHEEAVSGLRNWTRQRTRWLKGWMQTWAVHMRKPARLWRELGPARFIGFQAIIGGMVTSALVHPLFYLLVLAEAAADALLVLPGSLLGMPLWVLGLANVAIGYLASMALGLVALRRRAIALAPHVVFMPVYWLLISFAAYRALLQLLTAPHKWEKTEHGLFTLADAAARERAALRSRRLRLS